MATTQSSSEFGFGGGLAAGPIGAALSQNWWAVALRGLLAIAFGVIALTRPGVTIFSLVLVFAAYIFADGVFAIVAAVRTRERVAMLILEGVLDIVIAAIAVLWPAITAAAFVILVAVWAILTGGLMLAAAFRLGLDHGRWWMAAGGLVSVLYGVLLLASPFLGALVLTWWLGAYALIFGGALLGLALRLRALKPA